MRAWLLHTGKADSDPFVTPLRRWAEFRAARPDLCAPDLDAFPHTSPPRLVRLFQLWAAWMAQTFDVQGSTVVNYVLGLRRWASLAFGLDVMNAGQASGEGERLYALLKRIGKFKRSGRSSGAREPIPSSVLLFAMASEAIPIGVRAAIAGLLYTLGRPGELVVPSERRHDPSRDTCVRDVHWVDGGRTVKLTIWRKTDTTHPSTLIMRAQNDPAKEAVCPVRLLRRHWDERVLAHGALRPSDPPFVTAEGRAVTSRMVARALRYAAVATRSDADPATLVAASLRTTGTSRLTAAGVPFDVVRDIGGWRAQSARREYVREEVHRSARHQDMLFSRDDFRFVPRGAPARTEA